MPNLNNWDENIAAKFNIDITLQEDEKIEWESILEAATSSDSYLSQHHNDLRNLLLIIQNAVSDNGALDVDKSEENLRSLIDKSSVTGLNEPISQGELNHKRLIDMIHHRVFEKIKNKRPEITRIQIKRNTGNGGFYLYLDDENSLEVILRPTFNANHNKVVLEIKLATWTRRTPEMMGKPLAELLENPIVKKMYERMDKVLKPLLQNTYYFEGRTYPESGLGTYFKSFTEEHAHRDKHGWMPIHITQEVVYWINLANESLFSDNAIIETLTDSILAAYDLRLEAKKLSN